MVRIAAVTLTIAMSLAGCTSPPLRVSASFEEGASHAAFSRVYALVYMEQAQGWLARPLVDALGAELRRRDKLAGTEYQTIVPLSLAIGPDLKAARATRADSLLDCRVAAMSVSSQTGTQFGVRCELTDAHGKRIWRAAFTGHRYPEMDERIREAAQVIVDRMHGDGLI